jgi:hypothetical protein
METDLRRWITLCEAMNPKLLAAYRLNGKVSVGDMGETHIDLGRILPYLYPGQDVSRAEVGFVNHKGHFLDRQQAWDYAKDNDLLGKHAMSKLDHASRGRPQELDTDDLLIAPKNL